MTRRRAARSRSLEREHARGRRRITARFILLRFLVCYLVVFVAAAAARQTVAAFEESPTVVIEAEDPAAVASSEQSPPGSDQEGPSSSKSGIDKWTRPESVESSLKTLLSLGVLSLAPAVLLMTTSFVRIVVVLGLLRQALGTQQMPPNQVMTAISLFMTILIMTPVWTDVYNNAVKPYTEAEGKISFEEAWKAGTVPVKKFMSRQIDIADNSNDVWLFYQYLPEEDRSQTPQTYDDVPLRVLLPAFMLSELKIAFLIGFRVFLPFLMVDLVVSTVTTSMGMLMVPPMMVSLPLKLMLFVLVDGWNLVIGMLLESFAPYT